MNENKLSQQTGRIKHIYWKAVFVGVIVALGITFLFNLLTLGLGLSLFSPDKELSLTFGVVAWMVVGSYMTLFVAGWIGGRLVHNEYSFHLANGSLHGFVIWTLYLVVSIVLLGTITNQASVEFLKTFFVHFQSFDMHTASIASQKHAINTSGYAALLTFFIFLIGALGCCIGASCGLNESKRWYSK